MRDISHLIRAGVLALLVIIIFTVVRNLMLPESFGKYGYYRAEAVAEEMECKPVYMGADACKKCHLSRYHEWASGKHGGVNCENCHGQSKLHIKKPDLKSGITVDHSNALCIRCHLKLPARPHNFPQINPKKHMKGKRCIKCHKPHHPDLKHPETQETDETMHEHEKDNVEQNVKREGVPVTARVKKEESVKVDTKTRELNVDKVETSVKIDSIGKKIYEAKCAVCHGKTGDGKTPAAEMFDCELKDFSAASYNTPLDDIIKYIRDGKGDEMPAYADKLSDVEIQEVAKYVQGLKKPQ
jgi:mono/diheme cytochrome c family protein